MRNGSGLANTTDSGSGACCFTLTITDEHDSQVSDTTGAFCVSRSDSSGVGGEEDKDGVGSGSLEVTMSPEGPWTKGTAQEVSRRTQASVLAAVMGLLWSRSI